MADIAVILIVAGCAALAFSKGTVIRTAALLIIALVSAMAALGHFEALAHLITGYLSIGAWAHVICFAVLFVVLFVLLLLATMHVVSKDVVLGTLPEQIARPIFGALLGYVIAGVVLTAIIIAPVSANYPYQRFQSRPNFAAKPTKVMLNPDGFVTGLFGIASNGSFAAITNPRSFTALRPDFLDQIYLNRLAASDGVPVLTLSEAIETPDANSVWFAPENMLRDDGEKFPTKAGYRTIFARFSIKKTSIKDAGTFTLSQIRLICLPRQDAKTPYSGRGITLYPAGFLLKKNTVKLTTLNHKIVIKGSDVKGFSKKIDFVFYLPDGFVPVLAEFKLNNIVRVSAPVEPDKAPKPVPFM